MSDFLSNLIARSFTDAPVIQPRVPSLFETAADEFFDESQSFEPAPAAPETITPANAPLPVLKPTPVNETAMTKLGTDTSDASDTVAERHLPNLDRLAQQNPPLTPQAPQSGEQTAEVTKTEIKTKRVIIPADSFRDAEKDADKKHRASEPPLQPRSVQARRRKDFWPVEQWSQTSAPIIRVTIGRVEVREVHPPPPAPKQPKPAPPKLSLEDYLHKRDGGSR
jgi:hypothetical protein